LYHKLSKSNQKVLRCQRHNFCLVFRRKIQTISTKQFQQGEKDMSRQIPFEKALCKKTLFGKVFSRSFFIVLLSVFLTSGFVFAGDDGKTQIPKVARISFIEGNAEIRRADSHDWEWAVINLPLVEGDSIVTDSESKLEIQFDKNSYLRLDSNSHLKILTLRNEGIAVSLVEGNLSLRLFDFDKKKTFFEIDAPKTTVAIQKEGLYSIDASSGVEVKIKTIEGEARVYSTDSGFTLRTGRSAVIQVEGAMAGDWNFSMILSDEWDEWVEKRDRKIIEKLNRANYRRFYDDLLYGAEDLEEYGSWIYTKEYGWVWKPYDNTIKIYSGWSPYRYGHWRWIPPFGWVWICDEPWGWVTYHYGRWVYVNGWVWIPHHPTWGIVVWSPALVVITYVEDYICWYPLPYYYSYHYTRINNYYYTTVIVNNPAPQPSPSPTPAPSPAPSPTPAPPSDNTPVIKRKPLRPQIPVDAVVAVKKGEFGLATNAFQTVTADIANMAFQAEPDAQIKLPDVSLAKSRWVVPKPKEIALSGIPTGIIPREPGVSLDEKIRQTRVFDGRIPVEENPTIVEGKEQKNPGAIKRIAPRQIIKREDLERWEKKPDEPAKNTDKENGKTPPVYVPPAETPKQSEEPMRRPMPKPRQEVPPPPPTKEELQRPTPKPKEEAPPQEQKPSEKPDGVAVSKPLRKKGD
jgi:hypothetical protein